MELNNSKKQYVIYDTNCFVEKITKNKDTINQRFVFTDINLFEWLKGKNKEIRREEFNKIDSFIKSNNGDYLFRENLQHLERKFKSREKSEIKFMIADQISIRVFKDLFNLYVTLLHILALLICIKKIGTKIIKENKEFSVESNNDLISHLVNHAFVESSRHFSKKQTHVLCDALYSQPKEMIDQFGLKLFNVFVDQINKLVGDKYGLKYISGKSINNNTIVHYNHLNLDSSYIDTAIETFLDAKQNEVQTKDFVKYIFKSFLLTSGKFEFNDVADFYLNYISETLGVDFISNDDRFKRNLSISKN